LFDHSKVLWKEVCLRKTRCNWSGITSAGKTLVEAARIGCERGNAGDTPATTVKTRSRHAVKRDG
jgi:hypothetical protein